jgi:hypothetical protein
MPQEQFLFGAPHISCENTRQGKIRQPPCKEPYPFLQWARQQGQPAGDFISRIDILQENGMC